MLVTYITLSILLSIIIFIYILFYLKPTMTSKSKMYQSFQGKGLKTSSLFIGGSRGGAPLIFGPKAPPPLCHGLTDQTPTLLFEDLDPPLLFQSQA